MLARAVGRSLQTTALRATPAGYRIASTHWSRNLASNNRHRPPKKPVDYSKAFNPASSLRPSPIDPQRPTNLGAAYNAQQPKGASKDGMERKPHHSEQRSWVRESAPPGSDTLPKSEDGGSGATRAGEGEMAEPRHSGLHDEFKTPAPPPSDVNSAEEQIPNRPLPDLTQGIPSTLEYETMGGTSAGKPEVAPLNLTEDPAQGAGGRGRGELPASAYISSSEKKRLKVANYMYGSFAFFSLLGYVYLGRNWESDAEEREHPHAPSGWALGLMWNRAKSRLQDQLSYYQAPTFKKLLPDPDPNFERPYTLVLSLEDLLVHSEWSREHGWRMAKRPGVDYFLRYLSQYYELVIFTSVPWAIAEPVIKKLDPYHIVSWPLFREATMYNNGKYVKDLSYLNRDLSKVILIDTVSGHAQEQPENAIILPKWKGDAKDTELVSLIPFLEYIPTMNIDDVRKAISSFAGTHIPTEFAAREAIARRKFESQMAEELKKRPKSGLGFLSNALGVKNMPMIEGEQSSAEAFAQGKMLQDQARERGQKNYERLEQLIREEGDKWLKEEAAHEEMAKQEGMKAMKSGLTGFFGVPTGPKSGSS